MEYETSSQKIFWTFKEIHRERKDAEELSAACRWLGDVHRACCLETGSVSPQTSTLRSGLHYMRRVSLSSEALSQIYDWRCLALACLFLASKVEEIKWPKHRHGCLQERGFTLDEICEAADRCGYVDPPEPLAQEVQQEEEYADEDGFVHGWPEKSPRDARAARIVATEARVLELLSFQIVVHPPRPRPKWGSKEEALELLLLCETDLGLMASPERLGRLVGEAGEPEEETEAETVARLVRRFQSADF